MRGVLSLSLAQCGSEGHELRCSRPRLTVTPALPGRPAEGHRATRRYVTASPPAWERDDRRVPSSDQTGQRDAGCVSRYRGRCSGAHEEKVFCRRGAEDQTRYLLTAAGIACNEWHSDLSAISSARAERACQLKGAPFFVCPFVKEVKREKQLLQVIERPTLRSRCRYYTLISQRLLSSITGGMRLQSSAPEPSDSPPGNANGAPI